MVNISSYDKDIEVTVIGKNKTKTLLLSGLYDERDLEFEEIEDIIIN